MAITRVTALAGDNSFSSSKSLAISAGTAAGRVVLGQWDNDNTGEHLISATYNGVSCTLGTEEVFAGTTNANVAYLIGDASVASGSQTMTGAFTDGNHKPGGVAVGYNGVSAISVVAQGHGDTGGTPATAISLTGTGFNSGDQAVAFF